jgi:hypothetical protein
MAPPGMARPAVRNPRTSLPAIGQAGGLSGWWRAGVSRSGVRGERRARGHLDVTRESEQAQRYPRALPPEEVFQKSVDEKTEDRANEAGSDRSLPDPLAQVELVAELPDIGIQPVPHVRWIEPTLE